MFASLPKPHDRVLKGITVFVITAHLILFFLTTFLSAPPTLMPKTQKRLVVQSVSLQPRVSQTKKAPVQSVVPPTPVTEAVSEEKTEIEEVVAAPVEVHQEVKEDPPQPQIKEKAPVAKSPPKKEVKKAPEKKAAAKTKAKPPPSKKAAVPKKEVKKTPPPKSSKPKIENKSKSTADAKIAAKKAKQRELIASAQSKMAKVKRNGTPAVSSSLSASLPSKIGDLHIETFTNEGGAELTSQELTYYDLLASRLKLSLKLPEYGEVKIKLTLDRLGKYVKALVISAESTANRKYIEKTLPDIKFPTFGNNFKGLDQYTFVIAFTNN